MTIPVGRRASGILGAIARSRRDGATAPLVLWLREQAGVTLDAGECIALAEFLEGAVPKRPASRPTALSPQDAGTIIAAWRANARAPKAQRRPAKALVLTLATEYGVSTRTVESLARKARASKAPAATPMAKTR